MKPIKGRIFIVLYKAAFDETMIYEPLFKYDFAQSSNASEVKK